MIKKILIVINPVSGDKNKDELEQKLTEQAIRLQVSTFFYSTSGSDDAIKLKNVVSDVKPDLIIAAGGDGTTNLVADLCITLQIKMAILPYGSANGMAKEFDIPSGIDNVLEKIINGKTVVIDSVKINDTMISIHLSDLGLNARVIKRFSRDNLRGLKGYALQYISELRNDEQTWYDIQTENKHYHYKAIMIVIANARKYGTGAVINPVGRPDDGLFELIIIRKYPWYAIFRLAIAFFTSSLHKLEYVKILQCKKAYIKPRKIQDLQIDGETSGQPSLVKAEILPQSLHIQLQN